MKIIFVGMHNKPGKEPLCPSTATGKIVSKISSKLPKEFEVIRTNLFSGEYKPSIKEEIWLANLEWVDKIDMADRGDIIVLLGKWVQDNFMPLENVKIIKVAHPASTVYKSKAKQEQYVNDVVSEIIKTSKL